MLPSAAWLSAKAEHIVLLFTVIFAFSKTPQFFTFLRFCNLSDLIISKNSQMVK